MPANSAGISAGHQPEARGKRVVRGKASALAGKVRLLTLDHLDYRTCASRRARELVEAFRAELGGAVSVTQRLAIERASALMALAEDTKARRLAGADDVSLEDLVRIDNAAARAVKALGIGKAAGAKPPSLADYIAARGGGGAGASSAPPTEKTHHGAPHGAGEASCAEDVDAPRPSGAGETWSEMWARPYEAPGGACGEATGLTETSGRSGGTHAGETHPRRQYEDGEAL
jgi:hypothetical protein